MLQMSLQLDDSDLYRMKQTMLLEKPLSPESRATLITFEPFLLEVDLKPKISEDV